MHECACVCVLFMCCKAVKHKLNGSSTNGKKVVTSNGSFRHSRIYDHTDSTVVEAPLVTRVVPGSNRVQIMLCICKIRLYDFLQRISEYSLNADARRNVSM